MTGRDDVKHRPDAWDAAADLSGQVPSQLRLDGVGTLHGSPLPNHEEGQS